MSEDEIILTHILQCRPFDLALNKPALTASQQKFVGKMAVFLKKHPSVCLFIEGHTDERAPEAYNLSLGTKRSNCVRSLLIKQGVNKEQLFTISYGKERPAELGHASESWAKNRRAQFKIYQR